MSGLSENVRMLLKVMACFGTSTHDSVIDYLCESAEYCGVRVGLEEAVSDGFVFMDGEGHFKFAHDKVREAAYDLISDDDKKQVCERLFITSFVVLFCHLFHHILMSLLLLYDDLSIVPLQPG
jgi:predicted ATPase